MSNDCKLNLSLMGNSENLITWGTVLSRKGLTLNGIYMPTRWIALASVLLLGCPAYNNALETAKSGDILFVEADFFAALEEAEKQLILRVQGPRALVFLYFNEAVQVGELAKETLGGDAELFGIRLDNSNLVSDNIELYDLKLYGRLPIVGKDIVRVDEVCGGRPHEPNPSEDYSLSCSDVTFVLRPRQDEHYQESDISRIMEIVLS